MEDNSPVTDTQSGADLTQILAEMKYITSFINTLPLDLRPPKRQSVAIEDFNMPFWSLVGIILKISFASVPAAVIMLFLAFVVSMFFSCGILGAFTNLLGSQ